MTEDPTRYEFEDGAIFISPTGDYVKYKYLMKMKEKLEDEITFWHKSSSRVSEDLRKLKEELASTY